MHDGWIVARLDGESRQVMPLSEVRLRGSHNVENVLAAVAMVAGTVIARIYLGQAYISDAAAGVAAGLVWLSVCISGIEVARQREAIAPR